MTPRILLLVALLAGLASCNKPSATSDTQRAADEKRLTELRDLEERAAQREAEAKATQLEAERQKLADDQAALEQERQQLAAEREAARTDPQKQEQYLQSERRLAKLESAHQVEQARAEAAEKAAETARAAHEAKRAAAARKIDYFYDALDPHGDWLEVQPYGYVYQPRGAQSAGYRPYTDGTWVYTDYGWTWKGNEPASWATDHYGRWTRLKGKGWVWVPGSEWAPAWVSWRKSPQYVGWAPLPPDAHSSAGFNGAVDSYYDIGPTSYNFVPSRSLGEQNYRGVILDPERNYVIIEGTQNATRMHYANYGREPVYYNEGPDFDEINGYSARPISRYRLERESSRERSSGALSVTGDVLRLLAPLIASAPRAAVPPRRVSANLGTAVSDHGWGTGSSGNIQDFRNKTKNEAVQAEQLASTQPAATPFKKWGGRPFGTGVNGSPRPLGGTVGTAATPRGNGGTFGPAGTPRGAGGGFGTGPTPHGVGAIATPRPFATPGGTPRIGTAFTPRPSTTPAGLPVGTPIGKVVRTQDPLGTATPAATPPTVVTPPSTPKVVRTREPLGGTPAPLATPPIVVTPVGGTPTPPLKSSTPKAKGTPKAGGSGRLLGPEERATPRPLPPPNLDGNPGEPNATPRPLPPVVPKTTPVPHVTPPPTLPKTKPRTATGGDGMPVIPSSTPRRGPTADPNDVPEPRKTIPPTSTPRRGPATDPGLPEPRKPVAPPTPPRRVPVADPTGGPEPRRNLPPAITPRRLPVAEPNGGPDIRKPLPPVNKPVNATPTGTGKKKPGASPDPNDPAKRP